MVISGDASPEVLADDSSWLDTLPDHPIFTAPTNHSAKGKTQDDFLAERTCMAIRNVDVLVSHGRELRMASLLDSKYRSSNGTSSSTHLNQSSYKHLISPALDFDIERLIINPTGKLLAAVGSHKVAVVFLPRPGGLSKGASVRETTSAPSQPTGLRVKAAIVGSFYHHDRIGGKMRLADVRWHPWGEMGSSLMIMTKDGILREYNVSLDVEEPAQTVSLLPGQANLNDHFLSKFKRMSSRSRSQTPAAAAALARSRRSTSRLAFDDDGSASDNGQLDDDLADESFHTASGSIRTVGGQGRTAVAFTLGIDMRNLSDANGMDTLFLDQETGISPDWTPLTIFTLCTNGDIYALCPFMPKNASIPSSYLHSLSSYVKLSRPDSVFSGSGDEGDLQIRFVTSLLKQASSQHQSHQFSASPQRARSATPMNLDTSRAGTVEPEDSTGDLGLVSVQAPSSMVIPAQPQPQGPFLLAPAPHELSEERESRGADLFYTRIASKGEGVGIIGIASDDGRIDLCLSIESILPKWASSKKNSKSNRKSAPVKSGRYALSDSDSDETNSDEGEGNAERLPMLFVYESIDLGILSALKDVQDFEHALRSNPVRFVLDPLYSDFIYVHHLTGAHVIGISRWSNQIAQALNSDSSTTDVASSLERLLHHKIPSDVACIVNTVPTAGILSYEAALNPICSVCIVSDIYLCYSFLALAHSGKLVARESNLRVEDTFQDAEEGFGGDVSRAFGNDLKLEDLSQEQSKKYFTSLLGEDPFTIPEPFTSLRNLPVQPRFALGDSMKGEKGKSEVRVSPESLRTLATTVQSLRGQMREIVKGGNIVQSRLELQLEELKRQLNKLDVVAKWIEKRKGEKQNGGKSTTIEDRMQRILERQTSLERKSDRLLQKLMESHSPGLSVYEQRWLSEMTKMKKELGEKIKTSSKDADDDDDEGSTDLSAHIQALRHKLDTLKPDLEHSSASLRHQFELASSRSFGVNQLQEIEVKIAREQELLTVSKDKISNLNALVQRQIRANSRAIV
ncbi:uncharacterized protein FA14DRAFT_44270 [Meira miltonrushii]|uniref:Uncharacterized protein n=1 Tax=Meira miltonrushii TaxID=1280837 RepID=A0A316VDF2_9BASI|nr:uncharacterized protein FA14DRAFT_44270 [Meira miltonrushii]PWN35586.1 hypothetical protein FA14DRAFT_44270 [Meira miltonrushii]